MDATIRDAPLGQLIRYFTNNKYLQYPEEKPDFQLPETWIQMMNSLDEKKRNEKPAEQSQTTSDQEGEEISRTSTLNAEDRLEANEAEIEKVKSIPITPRKTRDGHILVDWFYTDDQENPHNWSNTKRALITTVICLYTFVVYTTSSLYTTSEQGVMAEFGVGEVVVTLGRMIPQTTTSAT